MATTVRELLSQLRSRNTVMSAHDFAVLAGAGLYGGLSADRSLPSAQTINSGAPQTLVLSVVNNDDMDFTGAGAPTGGFIIPTLLPDPEIQVIQLTIKCLWNPDVDGGRTVFTFPTSDNSISKTIALDGANATFGVSDSLVSGPLRVFPGDTFEMRASHGSGSGIDMFSATLAIIVLR